jgi:archaellum component FlaC
MPESTKESVEELRQKQGIIKDLEKEYDVIGVSFAVREGTKVPIKEAMDYVAEQIKKSAELINHTKGLIDHGRSSLG